MLLTDRGASGQKPCHYTSIITKACQPIHGITFNLFYENQMKMAVCLNPLYVQRTYRTHQNTLLNCFYILIKTSRALCPVGKKTDKRQAHLSIAGEGCVVKQEVGTKEEDDCIEHTQTRPVQKNRPFEEGVLCNVPDREKQSILLPHLILLLALHVKLFALTCTRRDPSSASPW